MNKPGTLECMALQNLGVQLKEQVINEAADLGYTTRPSAIYPLDHRRVVIDMTVLRSFIAREVSTNPLARLMSTKLLPRLLIQKESSGGGGGGSQ